MLVIVTVCFVVMNPSHYVHFSFLLFTIIQVGRKYAPALTKLGNNRKSNRMLNLSGAHVVIIAIILVSSILFFS